MTRDEFKEILGYEASEDSLKRINCPNVGKIGHRFCGWCTIHARPRFICGCANFEIKE